MASATVLEVLKSDINEVRIVEDALPENLADGQVLLEVDRFAVTANNITYTTIGETFGYWRFFPTADEAWGRVPVMGYATVTASEHPEVSVGERVWGFFPMGTHLVINAGQCNPFSFSDVSEHREGLAPIYAQFQRAAANPIYEGPREGQDCLLRGLFLTSWLCEDALFEADYHGAGDCLITSASSKTSIALGFAVKDRGHARAIAVTSERNRAFCEGLGCYDLVVTYDEVGNLDTEPGAVLVDMAGNAGVNEAIHRHYGDALRFDLRIGVTHKDAPPPSAEDLPGPKPIVFFAPHQAQKRGQEWGAEGLEQRIGTSFVRFREFADSWLSVRDFKGSDEARQAFSEVRDGEASPSEGYMVSLAAA